MFYSTKKSAVIVISSHVARGCVGGRAAMFGLQAFGFSVWMAPTIVLPWHPGHNHHFAAASRIVPDEEAFNAFIEDIANAPWIDEVDAVLTGYMANASQVEAASRLITTLKSDNQKLLHLCDPVIGDEGGLYVAEDTANAIRDYLLPVCDLVTPNRFELGWLSGEQVPQTISETTALALQLSPASVLVTSVKDNAAIGNLLQCSQGEWLATHETLDNAPKGTGDLTAGILLGHLLSGMHHSDALKETTRSVFEVLKHASEYGSDELLLEACLENIVDPGTDITITELRDL